MKFTSTIEEITRIEIEHRKPSEILLDKAHTAIGNIISELDYSFDLKSFEHTESFLKDKTNEYIHRYTIILDRTFEYPDDVRSEIESLFEIQDWGIVTALDG